MKYERVVPEELAKELGLAPSADGEPSWAGVAEIIRKASGRWGPVRKFELKQHAVELCEAAGFPEPGERVDEVIEALVELRDLEVARVEKVEEDEPVDDVDDEAPRCRVPAGRYLVPSLTRVVRCGRAAFLCGPAEEVGHVWTAPAVDDRASMVRWLDSAAAERALEVDGVTEWTFRDWLGVPTHRRHTKRRWEELGRPVGEAPQDLAGLWRVIVECLDAVRNPGGDPASYEVLLGRPGEQFAGPGRGGRWKPGTSVREGGVYCGARRAVGTERWDRVVLRVAVDPANRKDPVRIERALDLHDIDEGLWAILSRGVANGEHERAVELETGVQLQVSLPSQLWRLARLGESRGRRWQIPETARSEILARLAREGGIEILGGRLGSG